MLLLIIFHMHASVQYSSGTVIVGIIFLNF